MKIAAPEMRWPNKGGYRTDAGYAQPSQCNLILGSRRSDAAHPGITVASRRIAGRQLARRLQRVSRNPGSLFTRGDLSPVRAVPSQAARRCRGGRFDR